MSSLIKTAQKQAAVNRTIASMESAGGAMQQVTKHVTDAATNWGSYNALNPDATELADTEADLSALARQFVDGHKPGLAAALDVMASRLNLTRQDLLDELAAV